MKLRPAKVRPIRLTQEDLPMWRWAELVEGILAEFPPDVPLENMPEAFRNSVAASAEGKAAEAETEKEQQKFYYAEAKTQFCVDDDLSFCECLARAYSRLSEDRGERIFLRGNIFMAKLAKAVLEQDGEIFAEACEKYKDEAYFRECARILKQWNFAVKEGEGFGRDSWLGLYEAVLLLTGEYLATKCELPKASAFECSENSEGAETLEIIAAGQDSSEADLDGAALQPIMAGGSFGVDSMDDSSDNIKAGELFYEFLGGNMPKDKQADFKSMPKPVFKICAMESNRLGSYADKTISLNQRLVLNAISGSQKACFYLLLAMLFEYGNFFNEALCEKKKQPAGNLNGSEGIDFARGFMEQSDEKLLKEDFEFADFTAPDAKGEKQKFVLGISDLSQEDREHIFHFLLLKNWKKDVLC